jgi:hypothetical protein
LGRHTSPIQSECPAGVNETPGQWELTGGRRSTCVRKDLTHTPNIQAEASGCQCGNRPKQRRCLAKSAMESVAKDTGRIV